MLAAQLEIYDLILAGDREASAAALGAHLLQVMAARLRSVALLHEMPATMGLDFLTRLA
jgi:hypothetical protein